MAPGETENSAYAEFWGDKQEHYGSYGIFWSGQLNLVFSHTKLPEYEGDHGGP